MTSRRSTGSAANESTASSGVDDKPEHSEPASIYRSESFDLCSTEGRRYTINVALPFEDDPELVLELKGRTPTPVYTTDSITNFGLVSSLTRLMRWGGELPPCVIVAIGYSDEGQALLGDARRVDLTPTNRPDGKGTSAGYGGGPALRRFLVDVLEPVIQHRYAVDSSQSVLMGHSFGGLFALDTMVQEPAAFRNYLAISPSIWFDNTVVLNQLGEALAAGATYPGRLAVFAGEREERLANESAHMTSNVLKIARLVSLHRTQFGAALARIIPNASHHTILGPAVTTGLQFLLSPEARLTETF